MISKMNKLFVILLTGAYIPWCMMLLFYLLRLEISHFLSTALYLCFASLKWSHMPHANRNVIFWNRMFRVMEMCLVARIIVINMIGSAPLAFASSIAVWYGIAKMKLDMQKIATEAPIYCVCLLFLMSSTRSPVHHVASVVLISSSFYLWKYSHTYGNVSIMMTNLMIHYSLKIVEAYMVFLLEWASSPMATTSIIVFAILPVLYSGWAYYSLEIEDESIREYLFYLEKLPEGYPLPLNFKHAVDNCNIARKVFKEHTL